MPITIYGDEKEKSKRSDRFEVDDDGFTVIKN